MSTREDEIIEAALRLFFRFGMAKTNMADIAGEVGLSRQSVYASFASKQDLLRAATRHLADQTVDGLREGFATANNLVEKLDVIFESIAARHFALVCDSPEADEVINGFNAACKHELAEAASRYQVLIETELSPYEASIRQAGLDLPQIAEYICRTTKALKYEAKDEAHLKALWRIQRILLLKLFEPVTA